jgi:hypothetical protein
MSQVVKNIGAIAFTTSGSKNTKGGNSAMGDQGTVRITLRGVELVWGPNDSKTLADDLADEAVAIDSRLRIGDSRDGFRGTART